MGVDRQTMCRLCDYWDTARAEQQRMQEVIWKGQSDRVKTWVKPAHISSCSIQRVEATD